MTVFVAHERPGFLLFQMFSKIRAHSDCDITLLFRDVLVPLREVFLVFCFSVCASAVACNFVSVHGNSVQCQAIASFARALSFSNSLFESLWENEEKSHGCKGRLDPAIRIA